MMALVELTKPGPFGLRTHELGTFFGIRVSGELVAMTGERMKPGNFTEMTAVCVHPDHRGRGYAQALLIGGRPARSWRATKFRSCTFSPATARRSRSTGGKAWRSAAACTLRCCRSRSSAGAEAKGARIARPGLQRAPSIPYASVSG